MSSDPDTAYTQGQHAGTNAITAANSIGLGAGNIIYLDMEAYSSSCQSTVRRYVGGFSQALQSRGWKAGIYGSSCSPDMDTYATLDHVPDDAWIAEYDNVDAATPDVFSCVSTSYWTGGRRIHQYHGTTSVTYGGVTVSVDKDCLNGHADGYGTLNGACG
jgi:hypothetical protein